MKKIGIHYGAFVRNWNEEQFHLISKVKSLGFDLLEFGGSFLLNLSDDQIRCFREEAEEHNLSLTVSFCLSADQDISSPNSEYRKAGVKSLQEMAVKMSKVGASDCSGIINSAWNIKIDDYKQKTGCWDRSVEEMKEVIKAFEYNGVYLNVEVTNRFENFMINTCKEAKKYLQEVGSKSLGIHLDTFHMNIEENSMVDAITSAADDLRYFHLGENNRKLPGQGTMPWKIIFDSLKSIDYKGPIAMEPFVVPGGEVGSAVSLYRELMDMTNYEGKIKQSLEFLRSLLNE